MRHAIIIMAMMLAAAANALAGDDKARKAEVQVAIDLLALEPRTTVETPGILTSDQAARDYCGDILAKTDEQYAADTARCNEIIRTAEVIMRRQPYMGEWLWEKLAKKKIDPWRIVSMSAWADFILRNSYARYGVVKNFCNKQLDMRRSCLQRTMPEGELTSLYYREYGSSRPDEVVYRLRRDTVSGCWTLNGRAVGDDVPRTVRQLAEQYEVYKCMNVYAEAPSFPDAPLPLGGPPAWEFRCVFKEGVISSCSECLYPPQSIGKIIEYLKETE